MVLATILSMVRYVGEVDDRDFVDRLHSYFTANILIALSVVVSFKQFGGKPIECLIPDIFNSGWEQYIENFCWAQDTYYVPTSTSVAGMVPEEKQERKISYYQWVPFFLLFEAACFRLPSLLWKYVADYSGIKLREVIKLSSDLNNLKPEIKSANIDSLTVHLQGALRFQMRLREKRIYPHKFLCMLNIPYTAFFVTSAYIFTKFLYLQNACLQLFIMNKFLETDKYALYGFGAVMDLMNGTTWEQSGVFPRISLCDFEVRSMGNIHDHTIQCVLVINIFNEKIFIFLWFWFMMLIVLTTVSLLYWVVIAVFTCINRRFVSRHLEMSDVSFDPSESEKDVRVFVGNFLQNDGIFVLRMVALTSGVIFATDLVASLWRSFFGLEGKLRRISSFPAGATVWTPPPSEFLQSSNDGKSKVIHQRMARLTDNEREANDVHAEKMKFVRPRNSSNA